MVEKLILQAQSHVCNRLPVSFGEIRPAGEENGKFAVANLVSAVAKLLEQQAGIALVAQLSVTLGRLVLDDDLCRFNSLLPVELVLLGLCADRPRDRA